MVSRTVASEEDSWGLTDSIEQVEAHPHSLGKYWVNGTKEFREAEINLLTDKVKDFIKSNYVASNIKLQFYSNFSFEKAFETVNQHFSKVSSNAATEIDFLKFPKSFDSSNA
jgi:secreted Zn-dependent insulinase-like peptidase